MFGSVARVPCEHSADIQDRSPAVVYFREL
jgi:hypothetical protein